MAPRLSPKKSTPRFREYMRTQREALGMSTTELGAKMGITEAMVRYWERGDGLPLSKHLCPLCEVLHLDLALVATMIAREAYADEQHVLVDLVP